MEQDSALSLDLALNSTFSLCWEGFGISSKLLLIWAKTCTLFVWGELTLGETWTWPPSAGCFVLGR